LARHRLTDREWELIRDVFPPPARTGRPPRDRRQVVDGILWILRTGAPWRDLPEEFGPWGTVWDLFDKWNADGTLDTVLSRLRSSRIDVGEVDDELWCIDGTSVRAARCAGGGAKKKIRPSRRTTRWAGPAGVSPRNSMCCATAMVTRSTST
jgi:transposase